MLAGVADGDKVSSYARDAVAWAVENGYVASNGNLIDPQGSVYRARVVTIAVRYQPEQLTSSSSGDARGGALRAPPARAGGPAGALSREGSPAGPPESKLSR